MFEPDLCLHDIAIDDYKIPYIITEDCKFVSDKLEDIIKLIEAARDIYDDEYYNIIMRKLSLDSSVSFSEKYMLDKIKYIANIKYTILIENF